MYIRRVLIVLLCAISGSAVAAGKLTEVDLLREELSQIKCVYEAWIRALEKRIESLEYLLEKSVVGVVIPKAPAV